MSSGLPQNWVSVPIGDLGTWSGGGTPSKAIADYWTDGTVPWVSPKDMKSFRIRQAEDTITEQAVEQSSAKKIPPSSILMVTRSGILAHTFPVAVNDVEVAVNQDIKTLSPSAGVSPEYLAWFLKSQNFFILKNCTKHGTTVSSVDTGCLKRVEIPLAPDAEQRRIVEKIEVLFAQLDKGEEAVREVQTLLRRYRQSVLKAAFTGELTADWRAVRDGTPEDGRETLARILKLREREWTGRGRYRDPDEPDSATMPELPSGWTWASLEQIGYVQSGQTPKGVEEHVSTEGTIPWFKVSSMNAAGNGDYLRRSAWMFTEQGIKSAKLNLMPVGTIVFPKRGGAILTNKKRRLGVPGALDLNTMGFVPVALHEYIWCYFLGLDLRSVYDGSNVPQINYHDIADLLIAIPSEREADEIASMVRERLSEAEALNEICLAELRRSASLRQSILKDAFSGRLVAQDPSDEPASDLLERIRSDRAAAKPTRRVTTA
jgi:type I restriction enzyme S subunit